jgi:hypothetical protein
VAFNRKFVGLGLLKASLEAAGDKQAHQLTASVLGLRGSAWISLDLDAETDPWQEKRQASRFALSAGTPDSVRSRGFSLG